MSDGAPAPSAELAFAGGASLLGPANSEPRLISLAAQLEQAEGWQARRPPLFA